MPEPVLATKLFRPLPRPDAVLRPGLVERMEEGMRRGGALILVSAPAGFGKSTLLSAWIDERVRRDPRLRLAWLSLDEGDGDPARFLLYVAGALHEADPSCGADAMAALQSPRPPSATSVLTDLINEIDGSARDVALVLDDYHAVRSAEVDEALAFLLDHLPPRMRLVIATREDPSLPLARLRARGELAEIRAEQLRFTQEDAERLLNQTLGLALPPDEIHALWQRAEGWAAGLYLAGLSLRGRKDGHTAGFISALADEDRHIFDYLATEVLAGLPPRIRAFLLRTAVLGRFCAPLCDAATGSAGAQELLEEIEHSQLFLVPLDNARRWYRYHELFADTLRRELDRTEPGLTLLLHRRASAWHRQHGTAAEAINHAIAAGDLCEARELIAAHWQESLDEGLAATVASWLDRLPSEMVAGDAQMCLIRALLACLQGRPEDMEPWLAAAEEAAPQSTGFHGSASAESAICFYRALRHCLDGNLAAAEPASRQAAELELESGSACWRARTIALFGAILFWRGHDADARLLLERVIRPGHQPADNLTRQLALSFMAAISHWQGDHEASGRHTREAADLGTRHRITVVADVVSADLLSGRGELAAAETAALAALDVARHHRWRLDTAAALVCLATIYTRAGRAADAQSHLGEASDLIATLPDPGILASLLADAKGSAGQSAPAAPPRARTRRPDGLTDREAQVLSLLTRGCTNHEIAAELVVSVHTVERHLQNAYRKVGVRNRADASAYMARDGS